MLFFTILFSTVVLQRLVELRLSKHNERWLRKQGGYEVGNSHYKYIVLLHICFFVSLLLEVTLFQKQASVFWYIPFTLFTLAQALRLWSMNSLGVFWNTKIIVVPRARVVRKGPYKFMRHPNYLIVMTEIMTLPLIFQAYFTLILFTVLNIIMLTYRIRIEEQALREVMNYDEVFATSNRFIPKLQK